MLSLSRLCQHLLRSTFRGVPSWTDCCWSPRHLSASRAVAADAAVEERQHVPSAEDLSPDLVRISGAAATTGNANSYVEVRWSPGDHVSKFPGIYLRDNCPRNFCPHSYQRLMYLKDLDLKVRATDVSVCPEGSGLDVAWSDGHRSHYSTHWLWMHCLSQERRRSRRYQLYRTKPKLWESAYMTQNVQKFKFADVMSKDVSLHDWLQVVESEGFSLITDTPAEPGQLKLLARRVAFDKTTHYGPVFEVKTKRAPTNIAYTDKFLALHTDMPVLDYSPGIQLLHCIKQSSSGGENLFSDGFAAAELLKQHYPEYYRILTTTLVDFDDAGKDYTSFYTCGKHCTIQIDDYGEYERVSFSNAFRSSFLDIPPEDVHVFYDAMATYNKFLHSEQLAYKVKMDEGDIACFNNTRVLHGRLQYERAQEDIDQETDSARWLQGMYFDTDQFRSTLRVLKHKLGYYVSKPEVVYD